MEKKKCKINMLILLPFVLGSMVLLTSCTSNIKDIPETMDKIEKSRVYNASFDKLWGAALLALSEDETLKIIEKSGGIMVTEFRTVDSKELSILNTYYLLGKTYKNSYTLNFAKINNNKTKITIHVKLEAIQMAYVNREERNENVENYLRIKLFDKISENL